MRNLTLILTFVSLICLSACQVKEATSNGGLISGHAPTTNKFSLSGPGSKVYVAGDILTFKVSFPFDIVSDTTGGDPLLNIKVGGANRALALKTFSTPKDLIFEYTIIAGDNAPSGVQVQNLSLNGSVLQFLQNGALANCDTSTVASTTLSQVKIDTEKPQATLLKLTSLPGLYHAGDDLVFSLTFSETVFITGTPEFGFNLEAKLAKAKYISGSGSTTLLFSYKILDTDYDINKFNSVATNIDVSTSTIKDGVGNSALTDISGLTPALVTASQFYLVVGKLPYVIGVKLPADGSYTVAKTLNFEIEFDRAVSVISGTPKYEFKIGPSGSPTSRYATYSSGSGTNKLIFTYVTVPDDVDTDGIEVTKTIMRDGANDIRELGTTNSYFGVAANNSFNPPSSSGIILNSLLPKVVSVARNADTTKNLKLNAFDDVWIIDQQLLITVNFNTGILVDYLMGTPAIEFFINDIKKEATYLSGGDGQTSLIFRYYIQEGDIDNIGSLNLGSIVLHGGKISDALNTVATLTLPAGSKLNAIRIDGIRPTILNPVTPPADKTYSTAVAGGMSSTIGWSEEVHLGLATGLGLNVDIGGTTTKFTTTLSAGTSASTFAVTSASLAGKNDNDGVTLISPLVASGKVYDVAGNEALDLSFTPPDTSGVLVDTLAATVSSIVPLSVAKLYVQGDLLRFNATFSEDVTVIAGTSKINFKIGTVTKSLVALTSGTASQHEFQYEIVLNDTGLLTAFGNVTNVRDSGNNLVANSSYIVDTTGYEVDAKAPTILSSLVISPKTILVAGDVFKISITYDENVTVVDDPFIQLNFGIGDNNLVYESGSGTPTLVFSTTITNQFNMNGLPSNVNTLDLSTGTIKDKAGLSSPLTFPSKNLSTYSVTYLEVIVWSKAAGTNLITGNPTLNKTGSPPAPSACGSGLCTFFTSGKNLQFSANMNQAAHVFMILKTPTTLENHSFMSDNLNLDFIPADSNFVPSALGGTVASSSPLNPGVLSLIEGDFVSFIVNQNTNLLTANFDGAIGDIIIINSNDAVKLTNIRNHLNSKL